MTQFDHFDRRQVLRYGTAGAGLGFLTLGPWGKAQLQAAPAPSNTPRLVVVNLLGGNDGLNTVIPNTISTYFDRRPSLGLEESDGTLALNSGPAANSLYRLHPALSYVAAEYAAGDVALIQKVGYPDSNGSHFTSETIYSRAMRDVSAVTGSSAAGWVARLADRVAPTPTGAIGLGSGLPESFKGGNTSLLTLGSNLGSFAFDVDWAYTNTNDPWRKETVQAMLDAYEGASGARVKLAIEQGYELQGSVESADDDYTSAVVYPNGSSLATNLRNTAKLIQAGFDTRIFYVQRGGYDTHGGQANAHNNLHTQMDQALEAFANDLKAMGAWDNTVIMVISEFGRRNFENGSAGTDHGAGSAWIVLGGAIQGGMYGPDINESDLLESSLEYAVDFRSIYKEIVGDHLGLGAEDMAVVFPEQEEISNNLGIV